MATHSFVICYPKVIPSLNDMYKIGRNRSRSWMYMNPVVVDYKEKVTADLLLQKAKDMFAQYEGQEVAVDIQIICVFKQNFWRRDITNIVKATEDAISDAVGINDNRTLSFGSKKVSNDRDDKEYVVIVMDVKVNPQESDFLWSKLL